MHEVTIYNYTQYGQIEVFTGIRRDYVLEVIFLKKGETLTAVGTGAAIFIFCEALKKKSIPFQETNIYTIKF